VIPTHDRPELLRAAVEAVLAQDYPGRLRVVVVYDQAEPDLEPDGSVTVLVNERTPGLAGARNTGIGVLKEDLIAFCDDDDLWRPGKLRAQVEALAERPDAEFASCAIAVQSGGSVHPRQAGRSEVGHADLLRSRMVMVHSSTYLIRRAALENGIGLVDETIPGSQNEDWDLALRATRRHPIVYVDEPLVTVRWNDSLHWMLAHHPDLAKDRAGAARVYGQLSFAYACLRQRGAACRWAWRAVRSSALEPRVPFALAVAAGMVRGDTVLRHLNARGHGI
jgi:glycosyltransferase involved in cell wall biosynthesis